MDDSSNQELGESNMMNLDEMVLERGYDFMNSGNLDHQEDFFSVLYQSIEEEALGLKDDGKYKSGPKSGKKVFGAIKRKFKVWDIHMKQYHFYGDKIRPFLVSIKHGLHKGDCINLLKLMKYENEEYVRQLYLCMFDREPDPDGLVDNVKMLEAGKINKFQLMEVFYGSGERKKRKLLMFKGMARKKYGNS